MANVSPRIDLDLTSPLIVGFGVTSRAVTAALVARGFGPSVVDDRPGTEALAAAERMKVTVAAAPSAAELDALVDAATVVLPSPGVPDHHRIFAAAASKGVPVASEFDLAQHWDDRPLVAITGTNGKTTVTTMVADILNRSGRTTIGVGNTDIPLVEAIDDPRYELFVVEASSFRLAHSQHFSPLVACWLNFSPDHLDAHASLNAYRSAKASMWAGLRTEAVAVANADDPVVAAEAPDGAVYFSLHPGANVTWYATDTHLVGPAGPFIERQDLVRRQPHDIANALAAAAVSQAVGASFDAIRASLKAFVGLKHRLEYVGSWDDVSWYNDSKATVPSATLVAAKGFDSVVLIAGGRNKGLDMSGLIEAVPPVKTVVATGDAAGEVRAAVESKIEVKCASDMAEAVALADASARPGDVVLLSPGCTSFDWYRSYAERGDHFRTLVRNRFGAS